MTETKTASERIKSEVNPHSTKLAARQIETEADVLDVIRGAPHPRSLRRVRPRPSAAHRSARPSSRPSGG
jgi:hypothetical protein